MLLSIGGHWDKNRLIPYPKYSLKNETDGVAFADFLWAAYGPYNATRLKTTGIPRPLDGGENGQDGTHIDIDGFDFDIELSGK